MKRMTLFPVLAVLLICSAFKSSDYDIGYDIDIHQSCPQTNSYTVQLETMGGTPISASAVSPSTQYRIRITYSGSWCCNQNVAYCVVLAYGFSGGCSDSINGSTLIGITTDSSLPPFGIIGVVGPTDCSGSLSSAQGSLSTQQSIP